MDRIGTEKRCSRQLAKDAPARSEEHTSELQSQSNLVCRLLLEKKNNHQHTFRQLAYAPPASLYSPTPAHSYSATSVAFLSDLGHDRRILTMPSMLITDVRLRVM